MGTRYMDHFQGMADAAAFHKFNIYPVDAIY